MKLRSSGNQYSEIRVRLLCPNVTVCPYPEKFGNLQSPGQLRQVPRVPLHHCSPHKDRKCSLLQRSDPSRSTALLKRKLLFCGGRQSGGGIHIYKATSTNTLIVKYTIASSELLPIDCTKGDWPTFLCQRGSINLTHVCKSGLPKCPRNLEIPFGKCTSRRTHCCSASFQCSFFYGTLKMSSHCNKMSLS